MKTFLIPPLPPLEMFKKFIRFGDGICPFPYEILTLTYAKYVKRVFFCTILCLRVSLCKFFSLRVCISWELCGEYILCSSETL